MIDWYGVAAVIAAVAGLVSALGSTITAIMMAVLKAQVRQVHDATNGLKNELVESTRSAASAIGELKGRADQKAESEKT